MSYTDIQDYIKHIRPQRGYTNRLRQYNAAKTDLLPRLPHEQHDAVIRALCRRLKI